MFGEKQPPSSGRVDLAQPVWFFLIEVRVTGHLVQPWIAGSTALVQAFVPCMKLEGALRLLDEFLPTQELVRIDTVRAERHQPGDEYNGLPAPYIREPLEQASQTNECQLGIFVVSRETAWTKTEMTE